MDNLENLTPEEQEAIIKESEKPKTITFTVGINGDKKLDIQSSEPVSMFNIAEAISMIKVSLFNNEINRKKNLFDGTNSFLYLCQIINNTVIEDMAKLLMSKTDKEGNSIYTEEQIESVLNLYYSFCTGDFNKEEETSNSEEETEEN